MRKCRWIHTIKWRKSQFQHSKWGYAGILLASNHQVGDHYIRVTVLASLTVLIIVLLCSWIYGIIIKTTFFTLKIDHFISKSLSIILLEILKRLSFWKYDICSFPTYYQFYLILCLFQQIINSISVANRYHPFKWPFLSRFCSDKAIIMHNIQKHNITLVCFENERLDNQSPD